MIELGMLFILVATVYKFLSTIVVAIVMSGLVVGVGLVIGHFIERRKK